jgi:SAM-dependent methyltransferase
MSYANYDEHYANYYQSPELTAWRELGALDKADNVQALWAKTGRRSPARVLDIGSGEGALIAELERRGFAESYHGLEISPSGVEAARKRTFRAPVNFELYDGQRIPAADGSFDLVILSHVVEHLESPRPLLREAARVAELVCVEVPLERHERLARNFVWNDLGHVNFYDALLIRYLLQSIGLVVLAERITCPRKEAMLYRRPGLWHLGRYVAMRSLLAVWPGLACRLWTYHGSLIATSRQQSASVGGPDSVAPSQDAK